MKYPASALLISDLLVRTGLAELSFHVTAVHKGSPVAASDIIVEPIEPGRHRLDRSSDEPVIQGTTPVMYSNNWCGAVQHSSSSNPISSVHGDFQVPTLSKRRGNDRFPQYVSPWVGIDGATYGSALLQSGVSSILDSTGAQADWAWFEWIPDAAYNIPNFPVQRGDWIEVLVSASSTTDAVIEINNLSQDYIYTITLGNGSPLGRVDADWVVEDPATTDGLVPFAEFSTTWFQECFSTTGNSAELGVNGSTIYHLTDDRCKVVAFDDARFYTFSP